MSHRLTIKGQVTIPKEIRDFLGLEEGCSCVEFVVEADGSVANPCTVFARAPMAAFSPCLRAAFEASLYFKRKPPQAHNQRRRKSSSSKTWR